MRTSVWLAALLALSFGTAQAQKMRPAPVTAQLATKDNPVDLNSATLADLSALPRVGEETATKIIAARPFTSKEQLVSRKLLSKATYDAIADVVTVRPMSATPKKPPTK